MMNHCSAEDEEKISELMQYMNKIYNNVIILITKD